MLWNFFFAWKLGAAYPRKLFLFFQVLVMIIKSSFMETILLNLEIFLFNDRKIGTFYA
jgi:hypothetical protein